MRAARRQRARSVAQLLTDDRTKSNLAGGHKKSVSLNNPRYSESPSCSGMVSSQPRTTSNWGPNMKRISARWNSVWGAIQNQSYLACQNQSTEPSATWQHRVPTMDLM